jgi:transcriptional regulator with XRE-family HTH domain
MMSDAAEFNVGRRIRAMREAHGLSLRALAERSGLSSNAISLIERGENSPTVSSLHLLASALDVSITRFFEDEQERSIAYVEPAARLKSEANGIAIESLGFGLHRQEIDPFLLTLAPGAGNFDQPLTHAGQEFVYCLAGDAEYSIQDQIYRLEIGFSLLFDSTLPHCFRNTGNSPAVLLMVFYARASGHVARHLHWESL